MPAALVYIYDHQQRELPKRLTRDFHNHHDLAQATLHVHLDHESCMEVTVLKGRGALADHVIAERSVRHGQYRPTVRIRAAPAGRSREVTRTDGQRNACVRALRPNRSRGSSYAAIFPMLNDAEQE